MKEKNLRGKQIAAFACQSGSGAEKAFGKLKAAIGVLEFSLIGILAGITRVLAEQTIGVFVISTYNTDYVMTKEAAFEDAISALKGAGSTFVCA